MSETQPELPNRQTPFSDAFKAFIADGWSPYPTELPARLPASEAAASRRERVSAMFPGQRLVIPAGGLKIRSNDTDYRFRPHSAFAHLTGLGTDREPDAVLVLEPTDDGHDAALYFKPRAPRDSAEFYSDARYGEMWVGRRPSLEEMAALCGIRCVPYAELDEHLAKNAEETRIRVLREADPALAAQLDQIREAIDEETRKQQDDELAVALSELRLVKDAFEIAELRQACAETADAFAAVVRELPEAVRRGRGERWVEGVFGLHARHVGNAVGYDTIAASGDHACTLHWIRNDGDLDADDLILIDAGVELDTLYTADVTRTLPISGRFSDDQRMVYEAVLEAQQAGIDAAKPGAKFGDVHKAAIAVLARKLEEWGLLPVTAEESLAEEGGQHRRWMVHGTSHHLGIDVHDCAQARRENHREGTLAEGMIITVEPGLYFKSDDELVPENLRGIGVRIEDDVVITADGAENLSAGLPRSSADVEAWMATLLPVSDAVSRPPLTELVTEGRGGILLFGVTPPKTSTTTQDRDRIARVTLERLAPLDLDGLILYDIDDESDRAVDERPFPYLSTIDPARFHLEHLQAWDKPVVVYRSVGKYAAAELRAWLGEADAGRQLGVFVGAASSSTKVRTTLADAQRLRASQRPELALGAVMITERHATCSDEHLRMLTKQERGCAFFVSQVIYDVDGTKSVVSDYLYACRKRGVAPRPVIFTLAVCGSLKTLDFLTWLGVRVPRWLRNELTYADDPLPVSFEHCLSAAEDLAAFCRRLGLPYGFNVESVAIRKAEIEAAVELAGRLRPLLD